MSIVQACLHGRRSAAAGRRGSRPCIGQSRTSRRCLGRATTILRFLAPLLKTMRTIRAGLVRATVSTFTKEGRIEAQRFSCSVS